MERRTSKIPGEGVAQFVRLVLVLEADRDQHFLPPRDCLQFGLDSARRVSAAFRRARAEPQTCNLTSFLNAPRFPLSLSLSRSFSSRILGR